MTIFFSMILAIILTATANSILQQFQYFFDFTASVLDYATTEVLQQATRENSCYYEDDASFCNNLSILSTIDLQHELDDADNNFSIEKSFYFSEDETTFSDDDTVQNSSETPSSEHSNAFLTQPSVQFSHLLTNLCSLHLFYNFSHQPKYLSKFISFIKSEKISANELAKSTLYQNLQKETCDEYSATCALVKFFDMHTDVILLMSKILHLSFKHTPKKIRIVRSLEILILANNSFSRDLSRLNLTPMTMLAEQFGFQIVILETHQQKHHCNCYSYFRSKSTSSYSFTEELLTVNFEIHPL